MLGADSLMHARSSLALYSQSSWPYLTKALTDALAGNPDIGIPARRLLLQPPGRQVRRQSDRGVPRVQLHGLSVDATAAEQAASDALVTEKAPTIAPYWIGPDPCKTWPYPATGVREPITAEGAAPIVVVGTTETRLRRIEWAVSLADQLSSGVLVTRVGEGHTGYNKGNACVDGAVEAYLLKGTVPDRRASLLSNRSRSRRFAGAPATM